MDRLALMFEIALRLTAFGRGDGDAGISNNKKNSDAFASEFFQLNPPCRVGEITDAMKSPAGMKSASTAEGWI